MKISKLFHWLYASVMFLPLLIIPIFAIWTINHDNNQSISIDVPHNKVVDFNQQVDLSKINNAIATGFTHTGVTQVENGYQVTATSNNTSTFQFYLRFTSSNLKVILNHKYLISCNANFTSGFNDYYVYRIFPLSNPSYTAISNDGYYHIQNLITCNTTGGTYEIGLINSQSLNNLNGATITIKDVCLFDLTQMFGSGNEPTIEQFNTYFSNTYYSYTDSENVVIQNYETITYSDTDIGSQFIYTLYRSCDEYLNFDEVLNLGAISDWIETNVFNGNAPLVYIIVWHYLDYWLILSIFWLCFDVLIYVPQIAHRWLDKASLE